MTTSNTIPLYVWEDVRVGDRLAINKGAGSVYKVSPNEPCVIISDKDCWEGDTCTFPLVGAHA